VVAGLAVAAGCDRLAPGSFRIANADAPGVSDTSLGRTSPDGRRPAVGGHFPGGPSCQEPSAHLRRRVPWRRGSPTGIALQPNEISGTRPRSPRLGAAVLTYWRVALDGCHLPLRPQLPLLVAGLVPGAAGPGLWIGARLVTLFGGGFVRTVLRCLPKPRLSLPPRRHRSGRLDRGDPAHRPRDGAAGNFRRDGRGIGGDFDLWAG
jgi:hypothetical protein